MNNPHIVRGPNNGHGELYHAEWRTARKRDAVHLSTKLWRRISMMLPPVWREMKWRWQPAAEFQGHGG